jgi:hypothetical protein
MFVKLQINSNKMMIYKLAALSVTYGLKQGSAIYFYGGPDNLKNIFGGPEKT